MKKSIYFVAAMLLLVSCGPADGYLHFILRITDNVKAVITIDTSRHKHWWCKSGNEEITILSEKDNRSGVMADISNDTSYALYPADAYATLEGGRIATILPQYRECSAIAEPIMVAQGGSFEEVSAMLCINLSSDSDMDQMLKSITLSSALQTIAGRVEIDCTCGLAMNILDNGSNSIAISDIDTVLSEDAKLIHIVMPPLSFADSELCLTLEFENGSHTIALPQLTLERGVMHTVNCRF